MYKFPKRFGLIKAIYLDDTEQIGFGKLEKICDSDCGLIFSKWHMHWTSNNLRPGPAKKVYPISEWRITEDDTTITDITISDLIGVVV